MLRGRITTRVAVASMLALAVVVIGVVVVGGRSQTYKVSAMFTSATNVVPGLEVRAAGVRVGRITDIKVEDGQTRFELELFDRDVYPLPQGTRAVIRFGGTIGYVARYVELKPGPATAQPIPDGGLLPASQTLTPLDVDQVLRLLDRRTRRDLRVLLDRGGLTFDGLEDELARLLERTPAVTDNAEDLLADLGGDPRRLQSLVRSTQRVVSAVRKADPGARELLRDADTTFAALAAERPQLQRTLTDLPGTLRVLRSTFEHADDSLRNVNALAGKLAPGVDELRATIPPARSAVRRLRTVAPDLRATLATTRRAAPDLRNLLAQAEPVFTRVGSISDKAEPQLNCIRPYAPEAAAFFTGWGGFPKGTDGIDKYFRVLATVPTIPFGTPLTSEQALTLEPQLTYAFPRPPGLNAGQPWFLPECGVGEDALDPAKDPEAAANLPAGTRRSFK